MTKGRRTLRFSKLTDVIPDVDRLIPNHRTVGRWTMAQICNHLSGAIAGSIDGFAGRPSHWLIRGTVGFAATHFILAYGRLIEGVKAPAAYVPAPQLDLSVEASSLRAIISRFVNSSGPYPVHPFMGKLNRGQWERIHCMHCAHHLSFAIPIGADHQ